ncbi:MAG: futalosine hydrolase [Vulcanimicrobiaceae bacterium]
MILVVCALAEELSAFAPREGVDVLAGGIGMVEAAAATARALALGAYRAVVCAGIAGSFGERPALGEAVLVGEERLAGFGVEGGAAMRLPTGASLREHARSDPELLRRCRSLGLSTARGLTVNAVTASDATAARLRAQYGAEIESMEGFAVLRAAESAGVPALEVRAISNRVGTRARDAWNIPAAAAALATALDAILAALAKDAPATSSR